MGKVKKNIRIPTIVTSDDRLRNPIRSGDTLRDGSSVFQFVNGSTIVFKKLDSPEKYRSSDFSVTVTDKVE
jgi:hypothetical protein